jgi:membrane associated rhomboid family serine protease
VAALLAGGAITLYGTKGKKSELGGRNCPFCRQYNALTEKRCSRCEKWLPPRVFDVFLTEPRLREYWATKLLAGVSLVVFAMQLSALGSLSEVGIFSGMPMSTLFRFGAISNGISMAEPWRLLAGCFVHMGFLHVAMNMLAFAELGRLAETEIKGARLILAYVLTGIAGFALSAVWYEHWGMPYITAGASGAVFGIDGVLIGLMLQKKDSRWKQMLVRTIIHSFAFYMVMRTNQAAHMGGLIAGLALGVIFGKESRPWRIAIPVNIACFVSTVAIVLSIVMSNRSPTWRVIQLMEQHQHEAVDDADTSEQ